MMKGKARIVLNRNLYAFVYLAVVSTAALVVGILNLAVNR
jgi:hypothetical protein